MSAGVKTDMKNFNILLSSKEDEYTETVSFQVFCGSFNVNGKFPDEDLRSWLVLNDKVIDIYAIGFQEVVDLNTLSYLLQSDWIEREQRWIDKIADILCDNSSNKNSKNHIKYKLLAKYRMFGLFLLIFVNEKIADDAIRDLFSSSVPTGVFETVGNKGSVGISMKIHETRVCFVCSHFAADTDKLQKRNADYRATKQKLRFEYNTNLDYYDLDSHDVIFWFGDLNYRVEKINLKKAIEYIYSNEIDKLLKYDQLTNERNNLMVFEDFNEGKINFRPTYKYIIKEDTYEQQALLRQTTLLNTNESNKSHEVEITKVKLPSWTDRILWKSSNFKVELIQYSCINTITISDHKPVYALFDMETKKIDEVKYNKIYESLLKDSDKKINDQRPLITINKSEFLFQNCLYYDTKRAHFFVNNERKTRSNVFIQFYDRNDTNKFFDEDEDEAANKNLQSSYSHKVNQWVKINPQHKERIAPESNYKVELTTDFNQNVLARLNKNLKIDDFLIVRCLNGNDLFVTISCHYVPTIIGFSIRGLSLLDSKSKESKNEDIVSFIGLVENKKEFDLFRETIEPEIVQFEKGLEIFWPLQLKNVSTECEIKNVEKMFGAGSFPNNSDKSSSKSKTPKSKFYSEIDTKTVEKPKNIFKLEIFNKCFEVSKKHIIDDDNYFYNDLSKEYKFLMEHMIERCEKIVSNLDNLEETSTENILDTSTIRIEDQKNQVLLLLSTRNFDYFKKENFDLDLLAEVLYDLLFALPDSLIPIRYIDYCMYLDTNYEEAKKFLAFIPRSHLQLFELIVKFLQIYLKCVSSCGSNFNILLANAIFKINQSKSSSITKAYGIEKTADTELHKSQVASKFFKLFIENHKLN